MSSRSSNCLNMLHYAVLLLFLTVYNSGVSALAASEVAQFVSDVKLTVKGDVYEFFSSGYPDHDIDNSVNPSTASVQNFTYNFTVNPDNTGNTVWCTSLGPVGFAKNGVAIYNALTGESTDAVRYETFDDCKGHASPEGSYHYHQFPVCVGSLENTDEFIGIALDGNPIYGPKASDQTELLTSADLDACHGRYVNSEYRYHITQDFPYVLGCYKAEPAQGMMQGGPPGGGDGNPPQNGGGPPPMGRKKRQTDSATCTNTDTMGELCDCTSGTLTLCDTLTSADECTDIGDDNDCDSDTEECDDGSFATRAAIGYLLLFVAILPFC